MYGLKSKDLHLIGTGNRITSLKNNVNTYQKEKNLDFNKSIKNFVAIDDKVNQLLQEYDTKKKLELKTKKVHQYFECNQKQFA